MLGRGHPHALGARRQGRRLPARRRRGGSSAGVQRREAARRTRRSARGWRQTSPPWPWKSARWSSSANRQGTGLGIVAEPPGRQGCGWRTGFVRWTPNFRGWRRCGLVDILCWRNGNRRSSGGALGRPASSFDSAVACGGDGRSPESSIHPNDPKETIITSMVERQVSASSSYCVCSLQYQRGGRLLRWLDLIVSERPIQIGTPAKQVKWDATHHC